MATTTAPPRALLLLLLLLVVGGTASSTPSSSSNNVIPDLVVTEHNYEAERRMLKAFDGIVEKYDPKKEYGSGGFLGSLPPANGGGGVRKHKHGRDLIVPLAFVGLTQAIASGLQIFQTLVGLFGRTYQEALVAAHLDTGYSKMKGHTHVFKGKGLPYSRIPDFVEYMADIANMESKESREGLAFQLRWAEYGDGDMWKENQFTFNVGKGGMVKTFTLYINNDHAQSKLNIVTMTTDVSFKLAPDVFVILGMTSRFGGLMSSTSIRKVKKPQNVKAKHVTFTNEYFQLIGLQLLSDLLEIGKTPRDPDFGKRLSSNVRDPRPGFDDSRREGNVPPDQFRLPPGMEPSSAQQQQGGFPPQQGGFPPQQGGFPQQQGGYEGFPPQQGGYEGFPPQQGGGEEDCSNPMSSCYGSGGYNSGEQYPMQSEDPYGNGENGDYPMDGGYPSDGEYGGESYEYEDDDDDDDDDDDGGKRVKNKDRKKRRKEKGGKKDRDVRRKPRRKRRKGRKDVDRKPSRKRRKRRKPRKDVRKKRRKPSPKRRKSRKPSPKRKKSRKPSRKRRKSRKPSPKRRKSRKPSRKRRKSRKPSRKRKSKRRGGKKRGGRKLRGSVFPSSDSVRRLFVRRSLLPSSDRSGGRRLTWDEYDQCRTRCMAGKPRMYSTWTTWSSHCDGKCDYLIDI